MEEEVKVENGHLSSAAAFVEGGIQDAIDDACSICLEVFTESDPSTVTTCKHEFHLQCILDWCQRSSQCPMCWQQLGFKDSTSQDIFEGVVRERNIRINQERSTNILRNLALGDFELQHLSVGGGDFQINEHIFQQIAAAAAMGRARRDGQRVRSGSHGRPQYLVYTAHPNTPSIGSGSAPSNERETNDELTSPMVAASPSTPINVRDDESAGSSPHVLVHTRSTTAFTPGASMTPGRISNGRNVSGHKAPVGQDMPGPSDLQSFSESLKSRLNAVSMRYKESITKSTRGWRERLFSRSSTAADLGSEARTEVDADVATVSRMMDRLEIRESTRNQHSAMSPATEVHPSVEPNNEEVNQNNTFIRPNGSPVSFTATTGSQ